MSYSHLYPYPNFNPQEVQQLKVVATDTVIYVSTTGSDAIADGSLSKPFKSLSAAMNYARQHIIRGNAILYVRLLPGEYTVSESIDLYHPQGNNLVIEGDPSAFKQRTLWQVQNYSWCIQNFAGGGHTADIRLFDGLTNAANGGSTMHGLSGSEGMYFTITNGAIGSRDGYLTSATNGISAGTTASYNYLFHGDRFYNHGASYEDGEGILGIGRILGATASNVVVKVQFQNLNYDSRCPVWNTTGGLGNSDTWAGIANNYPETQYSEPNGYYGDSNWKNDDGTVSFPTKAQAAGAVSTITTDPYILSTYPVVIRANYGSNLGTLFLRNGSIRAIRNIFFAASHYPYAQADSTTGATLNYSQAFSAICDQTIPNTSNGTALYLENSTVGIRHLGFYGTGTAISAVGSRIFAYYNETGYTGSTALPSQNGLVRYAKQDSIDNAPVICTTQCKYGIVAKNSSIDLSCGSGTSRNYGLDYRHNGSYVSATSKCVELFGSDLRANSLHLDCATDVPKFYATIVVPVFAGATLTTGNTASFMGYSGSTDLWGAYPAIKVFMRDGSTPSSEFELGYVNYVVDGGSVSASEAAYSGATSGASLVVGSAHATDYRKFTLYGVRSTNSNSAMSYPLVSDIRQGITWNNISGGTFTVRFYGNYSLTGISSSYTVGLASVQMQGVNGVTVGYRAMRNANGTCAAPQFLAEWRSFGGNDSRVYMNDHGNALSVFDQSKVMVEKSLNIVNGGYNPVFVRYNSVLNIGDTQTSESTGNASPANTPTGNETLGFLSIRGFSRSALRLSNNSHAKVGVIFAKHPLHGNPDNSNSQTVMVDPIVARYNSSLTIGGAYVMGIPGHSTQDLASGLFMSRSGTTYGNNYPTGRGFLRADASRIVVLGSAARGESIFAFDGGTADLKQGAANRYSVPTVFSGGEIVFGDNTVIMRDDSSVPDIWDDLSAKCRIVTDTRTLSNQKLSTRAGTYLYNRSGASRAWRGQFPTSPGFTTSGCNIGKPDGTYKPNASSGPSSSMPIADGVTYTAYVEEKQAPESTMFVGRITTSPTL